MPVVKEITLDHLLDPNFVTGFAKDGVPTSIQIGKEWLYKAETVGGLSDGSVYDNIYAALATVELLREFDIHVDGWKLGHIAKTIAVVIAKESPPYFARDAEKHIQLHRFGGRSQVMTEKGFGHVVEYDMKAAYARALASNVAYRTAIPVAPNAREWEGIPEYWDCLVHIRNTYHGCLPQRDTNGEMEFPTNGIIRGTWLNFELNAAVDTGQVVIRRVFQRYRIKTKPCDWIYQAMEQAKGSIYKCLKRAIINAVGMMAYRGGGGHRIVKLKEGESPEVGDLPVSWEHGIYSRKQKAKEDANPYWYRPLQSNLVWGIARAKLIESLFDIRMPLSCHVDGILAIKQEEKVRHMREKKDYGLVSWECPWKGALFLDGIPLKTPGVKR